MGLFKKMLGTLLAGVGAFAIFKYLRDYTDYKAADKEDLNELKNGTENVRDAVKRTYIAIKANSDVTQPAGELGKAVAQMADGAGKVLTAVTPNTIEFAKAQKKKYDSDPEAFKQEFASNLKSMGTEAVDLIENLKGDAESLFKDKTEKAADTETDETSDEWSFKETEAEAQNEEPDAVVTDDPRI